MCASKRGESGISCVVGVDKPQGISSHDAVNAVRRIFGERRVGHTGTLDPLATGALAICVGPAARLDAFMVGDDKTYSVRVAFGVATDTDDAAGEPIRVAEVPELVCDECFARSFAESLVGQRKQLPPAYSAIKKGGVKSYEAARKGTVIELEPRDVVIYSAELLGLERDPSSPSLYWDLRVKVSKGTYIRSLARDIGQALGTAAHVESLRREASGRLHVDDCCSLERLAERGLDAVIDPVHLLGFRMAFLSDGQRACVANGAFLKSSSLSLFEAPHRFDESDCGPLRAAVSSSRALAPDEHVCLVHGNELVAIYGFSAERDILRPSCVFSQGVIRGKGL